MANMAWAMAVAGLDREAEMTTNFFRLLEPFHTGNMAQNATRYEIFPNSLSWRLRIDPAIAPHAVYTNAPWISPKWNGKKNPNEGWFDTSARMVAEHLAAIYGGILTERELQRVEAPGVPVPSLAERTNT